MSATSGGKTITYAYDDAFNLTMQSALGAYSYGANGAPTTCVTSIGADTFTWDDRGHLATAPWGTHTVDAEGRVRIMRDGPVPLLDISTFRRAPSDVSSDAFRPTAITMVVHRVTATNLALSIGR